MSRKLTARRTLAMSEQMTATDQPPLSIRLKIAPASMARAQRWGDYFFACSLQDALKDRGHSVEIDARDQWYADTTPGGVDLVLRGYGGFEPMLGRASLLWVISHPGNLDAQEMNRYHHVFTAAGGGLRKLRRVVGGGRVSHLFQATDPLIMQPYQPDTGDATVEPGSILFVGVDRRGGRPALNMAAQCGYDVALWGKGWDRHPTLSHMARGAFIPNGELGRHYAAAGVVLERSLARHAAERTGVQPGVRRAGLRRTTGV